MAFDRAVKEDALVAAARRCHVCTCFKGATPPDVARALMGNKSVEKPRKEARPSV